MGEKRQLLVLVILALALGAVAIGIGMAIPLLLEGDLVITRYQATLQPDGTFTEVYTYEVKTGGVYRMLYRYWTDPLSPEGLDVPYIEFKDMEVPVGTTGYLKDSAGRVILEPGADSSHAGFIQSMAENNEVGIYNPGYFPSGTYTVKYSYTLHPPIEYDSEIAHLNLRLVDKHIPYRSLEILVPSSLTGEVFPHPPGLVVERSGDRVKITGSLAADEVMGIEMLVPLDAVSGLQGFPSVVQDVRDTTVSANPWFNILPLYLAGVLYSLGLVMVFLTPFLFLAIYHYYGRERQFTVPEYLSFTPHPEMKPWAVNLLFKGDAIDFDQDGYYATLLDLHRRNLITIREKPDGKGVTVTRNQGDTDDSYEQKVLSFLGDVGKEGTVDSEDLQALAAEAKSDRTAEARILKYQRELAGVTRKSDPRLIARYVVDGRDHIIPLLLAAVALCIVTVMALIISPSLSSILGPAIIFWVGMLVQSGAAWAFPSTLFGHWKEDKYQEKMQWDSFARFLSDLARIKQYTPQDISMWGEWLVFGTALGVGQKVEHAMKELDISLPDAGFPAAMGIRTAFVPILAFTAPSRGGGGGGGFGGGSFGGGGGFGGGGVGGR
jgi:uncharacterized membrane protein